MPLTEQEREWLERRKKNEKEYGSVYCPYCEQFIPECAKSIGHCYDDLYCPLTDLFFPDVAEFEARVAEQLVRHTCFNCPASPEDCPTFFEHPRRTSKDCRLKRARLAAEAEMDR